MPTPVAQLDDLLRSSLTAEELRALIRRLQGGNDLAAALPTGGTAANLASETVALLARKSRVDAEFFRQLMKALPERHAEVAGVAAAWEVRLEGGADQGISTPGTVAESTVEIDLAIRPPDRWEAMLRSSAEKHEIELISVGVLPRGVFARVRVNHPSEQEVVARIEAFREATATMLREESEQDPPKAGMIVHNQGTIVNSNLGDGGRVEHHGSAGVHSGAADKPETSWWKTVATSAAGRALGTIVAAAVLGGLIFYGFWWPEK